MHVRQPADSRPASSEEQQPGSLNRAYVVQGVQNTAKAFVLPTILAPLVAPQCCRPLTPLVAGMTLAHLRSNPAPLAFRPAPSAEQAVQGAAIGYLPFAVTFPLHTKLQGMKQLADVSAAVGQAWTHAAPAPLRAYPIQFVAGRVAAQLSAAAVGSVAQQHYLASVTGGNVVQQSPCDAAPGPRGPLDPVVGGVAFSLFSIPAACSTPSAARVMTNTLKLGPVTQTAVVTGLLIGAAVGTSAASVFRADRADGTREAQADAAVDEQPADNEDAPRWTLVAQDCDDRTGFWTP